MRGLLPTHGELQLVQPPFVPAANWDALSAEEKRRRHQEFEQTPSYQRYARRVKSYRSAVGPDGALRCDDVPAGEYTLTVDIQRPTPENPSCTRRIGSVESPVQIPEIAGGRSDTPLEIASVELKVHHFWEKGDLAPAFEVNTFDGKTFKLSDYRGKYVLLDFWATWCGPCVAAIKHMEQLHATYGKDERFVMVSVSVDDRPEAPSAFLQKRKLPWLQVFAGSTIESSAWQKFGLQAIPSVWLIGPDGKIIAKYIADEEIDKDVAAALAPNR